MTESGFWGCLDRNKRKVLSIGSLGKEVTILVPLMKEGSIVFPALFGLVRRGKEKKENMRRRKGRGKGVNIQQEG